MRLRTSYDIDVPYSRLQIRNKKCCCTYYSTVAVPQNGMAYEAEGGIYFDVERMGSEYGKLGVGGSESATPETEGGSDLRGKRSHRDFALWKRAKQNEPW